MPTPQQIKLIHIALRQVGLDEGAYRLLLANVAGKRSCLDLSNDGVEDVMAVMEDMGFRMIDEPGDYWRKKISDRGCYCGARMAWRIKELARRTDYNPNGMAIRMSHGRTSRVELLKPHEAFETIEAYKKILARKILELYGPSSAEAAVKFTRGRTNDVTVLQPDELITAYDELSASTSHPSHQEIA